MPFAWIIILANPECFSDASASHKHTLYIHQSISWFDIPMNPKINIPCIWYRNQFEFEFGMEIQDPLSLKKMSCLKIQGTEHRAPSVVIHYICHLLDDNKFSTGSTLSRRTCSLFVLSILMTILSVRLSVLSSI